MPKYFSDVHCELVLVNGVMLDTCTSSVLAFSTRIVGVDISGLSVSLAPRCGKSLLFLGRCLWLLKELAGS